MQGHFSIPIHIYTSVAYTGKGIHIYSKVLECSAQSEFTLLWV